MMLRSSKERMMKMMRWMKAEIKLTKRKMDSSKSEEMMMKMKRKEDMLIFTKVGEHSLTSLRKVEPSTKVV